MRVWTVEELRFACVNTEATWDSCAKSARGGVRSVSFGHPGRDDAPCVTFVFAWDRDAHGVRVKAYVHRCTGCTLSHRTWEDEVAWTACPPGSWEDACMALIDAWSLKVVREVVEA